MKAENRTWLKISFSVLSCIQVKPKEIGSELQYEYSYKHKLKPSWILIQNLLFPVKKILPVNFEQAYTNNVNTSATTQPMNAIFYPS